MYDHDDGPWEDIPRTPPPPGENLHQFPLGAIPPRSRHRYFKFLIRPRRKLAVLATNYSNAATSHQHATPESRKEQTAPLSAEKATITTLLRDIICLLLKPLPFLISFLITVMLVGHIITRIQVALAPLCLLPGVSSSKACHAIAKSQDDRPLVAHPNSPRWADYPSLIPMQTVTFEQLLNQVVGGSSLSLEIKKAQMATSDLVNLVRMSDLDNKAAIADLLEEFVEDARWTG
jgi:hypothetical protein